MDEIVAWADKLEQPAIRRLGELPSHADQHPNRYPCRRFPFDRLAFTGPLPDNQTLELRTDLVGANQNDAWAGIQFLWSPELQGYALFKDQDEVALVKFWNGATSLAWFFYENRPLKNQNVTLVLALTRVGSDLRINTRVLDKDNANAVLFERTVTDTPQADPVLPNPA